MNWAQYRPAPWKFTPSNIPADLCTHIVYASAKLDITSYEITNFEWNDHIMYGKMAALKQKNPKLKMLLAVGGYRHESPTSTFNGFFSTMVNDEKKRSNFVATTVKYLRDNGFDGLDLDWEYPTKRAEAKAGDKRMFSVLCKDLIEKFAKEALQTGKSRLLLTAAVSASIYANNMYEISKLGRYLDILNLMSYDLYGAWNTQTGHHTAVTSLGQSSVLKALLTWINNGFPKDKIALGLATYGRDFKLNDTSKTGIGAPVDGAATAGTYTRDAGFLSYYEICELKKTVYRDIKAKAPYAVYNVNQWVGYDDEQSLRYKARELIKKYGLKGAMFWALDLDDFLGTACNKGAYPLINAVKDELKTFAAAGAYANVKGQTEWCKINCAAGFCPATHCKCV